MECARSFCMVFQNGIQYKSRQTSLDEGGEEGTSIKLTVTKEHLTACPNCGMGMWKPKVRSSHCMSTDYSAHSSLFFLQCELIIKMWHGYSCKKV